MTWRPITEKPDMVGPYRINDVFGHFINVQWDGRHFRYADDPFVGTVVAHYKGDLWSEMEAAHVPA